MANTQGAYPTTGQPGYPAAFNQQPIPVGSHTVTVGQPGGAGPVYPPDYCALAWFACLCCCWPIGVCAILKSNNTRDAIRRGDVAAANSNSEMAKKYAIAAIVIGFIFLVIIVVVQVANSSNA